jgi:hypothetical protein
LSTGGIALDRSRSIEEHLRPYGIAILSSWRPRRQAMGYAPICRTSEAMKYSRAAQHCRSIKRMVRRPEAVSSGKSTPELQPRSPVANARRRWCALLRALRRIAAEQEETS